MTLQTVTPQLDNPAIVASASGTAAVTETNDTTHEPLPSGHQFPEFPEEAYVGVLAEFADLESRYYESPKEFIYLSALLQVGIALCGRIRADFGSLGTQPRLYGLKIGPVGTSKKTTADSLAEQFIAKALNSAAKTEDDELFPAAVDRSSQWVFVLPGAGSGEGVLTALEANKRVFLKYDEFERFAKKANAEGSVLGTAVNELFESTSYANATKDNIRSVSGVYLGFSANMPLEQFESTSGVGRLQELGLWSRLIFAVADRRHRILKAVDPPPEKVNSLVERLAGYFKGLPTKESGQNKKILIPAQEIRLVLTTEAQELWQRFEDVIGYGSDATRLDTIGMRLMTILAFTSGKREIDAEIVKAVLAFLKYQKTVREQYKPSTAETTEARVEALIMKCMKRAQTADKTPIAWRDIRNNTSIVQTYGVDALRQGLERLVNAQMLERTKTTPFKYRLGSEAE